MESDSNQEYLTIINNDLIRHIFLILVKVNVKLARKEVQD